MDRDIEPPAHNVRVAVWLSGAVPIHTQHVIADRQPHEWGDMGPPDAILTAYVEPRTVPEINATVQET